MKFSRCKDYEQIMSVEKDLKKVKIQDIGLTSNQFLFKNTNLCSFYQMLWLEDKRLHELILW